MNEENTSLAISMQQTIEYGNLEYVADIGEVAIDATLQDGILKDIPILGSLVGVYKCIRNTYDVIFAKKLIAFLVPISDVPSETRSEAINRWERSEYYRGKVGETLIGMIQRCDDSVKAEWLSKLFYELVLRRDYSRIFMRAEKALSSLSVMDIQAFLNIPKEAYSHLIEKECEAFLGSGLYRYPKLSTPIDGTIDFDNQYCEVTETGRCIYHILNNYPMPLDVAHAPLF